eukprot:Hpha_TRINITY_DN27141_c0_g1::TRINITY_DN27141_c0_g1_i1::g.29452::m.29452
MRYVFETARGHAFELDCDPCERVQVIVTKAALDRGYDKLLSTLECRGAELDPSRTLEECGVRPEGVDIITLRGEKRQREVTAEEEEEDALRDAQDDHAQGDHSLFSLETLRDNIKRRREELDRPTFLTRKQREELAQKRRAERVQQQQERMAAIQETRRQMLEESRGRRPPPRDSSAQERLERTEALYAKAGSHADALREATARKEEQEQIRAKYLGRKREKKVVAKPSERFLKFTFEWGEHEDTSVDTNTLYARPHEAQMLFGRGFRAGADAREQEKSRVDYKDAIFEREVQKAMKIIQQKRERKERRRAARAAAAAAAEGEGGSEEDEDGAPESKRPR